MRILFDSKQLIHKNPFGTLTPGQTCTLHVHIPAVAQAVGARCCFQYADGAEAFSVPMTCTEYRGAYGIYEASFSIPQTGLYFYYFLYRKGPGRFPLVQGWRWHQYGVR